MERFMSENNSGANIQQSETRGNDQGKEKRQKFDPAKQEQRRNNNRNNNRRRRNNGPRQGGFDKTKGEKGDNAEATQENKNRGPRQGRDQSNKFKRDREQNQNQNQGGEKKGQQFNSERKPKQKRTREIDAEVAKNVKKVETIDDIRSDNARITKEIYLEIASLKNINLN